MIYGKERGWRERNRASRDVLFDLPVMSVNESDSKAPSPSVITAEVLGQSGKSQRNDFLALERWHLG